MKINNEKKIFKAFTPNCQQCWGVWGHKLAVDKVYHRDGIEYGYRPSTSWKEAFLSLFTIHNESMNTWTHLIGFLFTFYALIIYFLDKDVLFSYAYPFIFNTSNDFISNNDLFITQSSLGTICFFAFIISASICLLCSTIYHWFNCVSPYHHDTLLYVDLTGVALLVGSSYLPAVYLGFYCFEGLQSFYLGLSVAVLLLGLIATWVEIEIFHQPIRPFIFAGYAFMLICHMFG